MTTRDLLLRRLTRIRTVVAWGIGVFAGGVVFGMMLEARLLFFLIPFAAMVVALTAAVFGQMIALRCPSCHGNLAELLKRRDGLGVDREIRLCPFCGFPLDDELIDPTRLDPAARKG